MDYDNLPNELLEEIFQNLDGLDLWRCLGVSKKWRNAANRDKLWEKHCLKLGIEEVLLDSLPGAEDLSQWAAAYYSQHLMPIRNWKLGQHKIFRVPVEDSCFHQMWKGSQGAFYYDKINKLMIHKVHSHGITSSELVLPSFFEALPRGSYTRSIRINKDYIAVSNGNMVIVYRKVGSQLFQPFKIIYFMSDNLRIVDYNAEFFKGNNSFDSTPRVVVDTIITDILWMRDSCRGKSFIVNLLNDSVRIIPGYGCFWCYPYTSIVGILGDKVVKLYDKYGDCLLKLNISCWEISFNSEILLIGDRETQKVETWEIKLSKRLTLKSVFPPGRTDMIIHPTKNIFVIGEKSKDTYMITCIDAITGLNIWKTCPPLAKKDSVQIEIVSEYVFVCYSDVSSLRKFSLLDLSNGKMVNNGLLPQSRIHISTTLWVVMEDDHFKVMSYLG